MTVSIYKSKHSNIITVVDDDTGQPIYGVRSVQAQITVDENGVMHSEAVLYIPLTNVGLGQIDRASDGVRAG